MKFFNRFSNYSKTNSNAQKFEKFKNHAFKNKTINIVVKIFLQITTKNKFNFKFNENICFKLKQIYTTTKIEHNFNYFDFEIANKNNNDISNVNHHNKNRNNNENNEIVNTAIVENKSKRHCKNCKTIFKFNNCFHEYYIATFFEKMKYVC